MASPKKGGRTAKAQNDARPNGKGWKKGKSPEVRLAEEAAKREAKRARKAG